jgi:hypothetical protein
MTARWLLRWQGWPSEEEQIHSQYGLARNDKQVRGYDADGRIVQLIE